MSTASDTFRMSVVPDVHDDDANKGGETRKHERRDRRESYRVPLRKRLEAEATSPCRLTDISAGGVGFLAPRRDAALLDKALLLIYVSDVASFRAVVQRVDIGGSSEAWVRVGARFVGLSAEDRASLCTLVTAKSNAEEN